MSMHYMKKGIALGIVFAIGMFGMVQHTFAATPNFTVSNVTSSSATINTTGLTPGGNYLYSLSAESPVLVQDFSCNSTQNCNTTSNYVLILSSLTPNTDYSLKLSDSTGAVLVSHFFSTESSQTNNLSVVAVVSSITSSSARIDVSVTNGEPDGLDVLYGVSPDTALMAHDETLNDNGDATYDLVLTGLTACRTYYYTIQDSENSSTFYTSVKSFQTIGCGGTPSNPAITVTNITPTSAKFQVTGLTVGETYHIYYYEINSNSPTGSVDLNSVSTTTVTTAPISLAPDSYMGKLFNDTDPGSIAGTSSFVIAGNGNPPQEEEDEDCPDGMEWSQTLNACEAVLPGEEEEVDPTPTQSQGSGIAKLANPLGSEYDSFPKVVVAIIDKIILPVAIPFVALAIIWVGFEFVIARGNPQKLKDAKKALGWTLLGAAVILGAYVIGTVVQSTISEITGNDTGQTGMLYDIDHNHYA